MSSINYVVVGLGNPGREYEGTRHNVGFKVIDFIADKLGADRFKESFKSLNCITCCEGKKILLVKPQTYMNLSGQSVAEVLSFYKVPPENLIVIFDDISLPVGKMRIRLSGSHGGHNGIKNIISFCSTDKFTRIKIGVGEKPNSGWDLSDWVLSNFSKEDSAVIDDMAENAYKALKLIVNEKTIEAMNKFN